MSALCVTDPYKFQDVIPRRIVEPVGLPFFIWGRASTDELCNPETNRHLLVAPEGERLSEFPFPDTVGLLWLTERYDAQVEI